MIISPNVFYNTWTSMNKVRPRNFIIKDKDYYAPTLQLLNSTLYPSYSRWLKSINLGRWYHKWDCDNFADAFKTFVDGYYFNVIESTAESISIGVVFYNAKARTESGLSGGHAINVVFLNNEKNLNNPALLPTQNELANTTMVFLEPQNGQIINMTESEFNSIWFFYI